MVIINVVELYGGLYQGQAKLDELPDYIAMAKDLAGEGNDVTLTGPGPVWLYLSVAHALHGVVKKLSYMSPITGVVEIFDHNPY